MKPTLQARLSVIAAVLWVALGAVLFGVGGDDPTHVSFFGSVKVDGKPLERGTICFFLVSPSSEGASGSGYIHHGRFVLDDSDYLVPGTYNVMIRGLPESDVPGAAGEESRTEPLPERFKLKRDVELEISRGGSRRLEFHLKR